MYGTLYYLRVSIRRPLMSGRKRKVGEKWQVLLFCFNPPPAHERAETAIGNRLELVSELLLSALLHAQGRC